MHKIQQCFMPKNKLSCSNIIIIHSRYQCLRFNLLDTKWNFFLLSDFIARTYLIKFFFTSKRIQWLLTLTSIRSAPFTCTEAWCFLQAEIFIMGAFNGITTVTGIPRSLPWYDNARAWFPADAAITPFSFCSYGKVKIELKMDLFCLYSRYEEKCFWFLLTIFQVLYQLNLLDLKLK